MACCFCPIRTSVHYLPSSPPEPTPITISEPKPTPSPKPPAPTRQNQQPVPPVVLSPTLPKAKAPAKFDFAAWEHETIEQILKVTLDKAVSERSGYDIVWLKYVAQDMVDEGISIEHLNADMIDRLLSYRLSIDPQITDDLYCLSTLASLPAQQTAFEYLVGSWKRFNSARTAFKKKGYPPLDTQKGLELLEKIRHLVLTYVGLNLQNPEMFSQPEGRPVGAPELIAPLLSLSALSTPFLSAPPSSPNVLTSSDIGQFIQDLACRFEPDSEIDNVLGPVVNGLLFHESLFRPEGLGGDASWRGVIRGLEALVSTKSVATMITRMEAWNPPNATALNFERTSLLGPLCRLGVFYQEWASFHVIASITYKP